MTQGPRPLRKEVLRQGTPEPAGASSPVTAPVGWYREGAPELMNVKCPVPFRHPTVTSAPEYDGRPSAHRRR